MKTTFGRLRTELPDNWSDGSVVQWTGPATDSDAIAPSIVITRAANAGEDLAALLTAHVEQLEASLVNVAVQREGTVQGAAGPVFFLEHRFGDEHEISQILLVTATPETIFIVTGTASTSDYGAKRPIFIRAATELEV